MAEASDARLAQERGGSARGTADRRQGPLRHRRGPHPGVQPHPRRLQADLRIDRHREFVARRRGDAGQAQYGRVRHGLVERDVLLRARRFALAAAQLEPRQRARGGAEFRQARAPDARRLVRRLLVRRRRRASASPPRRATPAARSASPPPSPALSASSRPTAGARDRAWSPSPRRSIRPDRSRAPCATPRSCCARWPGPTRRIPPARPTPVPDYEAAVGRSVKGMTIGVPKEYRLEGMSSEIEALMGARRRMAARRGRKRGRRQPAATRPTRCLLII